MRTLVVGVVGHVDHGKTSLVRALTGMETDRLAEEQARGISIALGFAHLRIGNATIDLIDMPGHERFVRTMVAGAAGIGAILLVIDAAEGIKPQTREHLDIATLLGIRHAIIAISRCDLAAPETIARTQAEAAGLVAASRLGALCPIVTSTRTGAGLPALCAALAQAAEDAPPHEDHAAPFLPIDRAFSIAGHGTVVTGTLRGGPLAVGDALEIAPAGTPCRIRALQVHGARVATAAPGQRVAVNVRGIEAAQAPRGATLALPGTLPPSAWLSVYLRSVADAPPLATGTILRLLIGTEEVDARLRLLDCDGLPPGERAFAQLRCTRPISAAARTGFVLRASSPPRTLAGGTILDPHATRARRHAPGVLARLSAFAGAKPPQIVLHELGRAGLAGASLAQLSRLSAQGPARTAACLTEAGAHIAGGHALSAAAFTALLDDMPRMLAAHPDGIARGALATLLPAVPAPMLEAAAACLVAQGTLARAGATLRIPRPEHDAERRHLAEAQAARIAETLRCAGLCPPDAAVIAPDITSFRLLDQLVRAGIVIRAPDRVQKREILFHRDAIEAARRQLSPLLAERPLLVSEIGAALGISRKYSVPLLEYLDSVQFSARAGERRRLATPR